MKKYNYILAVDPDVDKSGVAILNCMTQHIEISSQPFFLLLDTLKGAKDKYPDLLVCIEAGWLNKTHWHLSPKDTKNSAAAKGNSVGRNHEVGRKLVEMANHYGLSVKEVKPLVKMWKGTDKKITHAEISSFIRPFPNISNPEQRDAALIAWLEAGLPIQMKAN